MIGEQGRLGVGEANLNREVREDHGQISLA